jgi:hypothetical protein
MEVRRAHEQVQRCRFDLGVLISARTTVALFAVVVAVAPEAAAVSARSSLMSCVLHVPGEFPTIADAIAMANDGDTIQLAPGTYVDPFSFGFKAVTLRGSPDTPGTTTLAPLALKERNLLSIPALPEGDTITLEGLTLGGYAAFSVVDGSLALRDCIVTSDANGLSIAFHVMSGSVLMERLVIADSGYEPHDRPLFEIENGSAYVAACETISGSRPILHGHQSDIFIDDSIFAGLTLDTLPTPVGAIESIDGSLTVRSGSFDSIGPGTGIVCHDTDLLVDQVTFDQIGDPITGIDLAIWADGPSITLRQCSIRSSGSFAAEASAAILDSPNLVLEQCLVANNTLSDIGCGGVIVRGSASIQDCTFVGNSTFGRCGALRIQGASTLARTHFSGNVGGDGEGAVLVEGTAHFEACSFLGNSAGDGEYPTAIRGGALGVDGGVATLTDCMLAQNSTIANGKPSGEGGAIAVQHGGSVALMSSSVIENVAMSGGGGVWVSPESALSITGSSLCENLPDQIAGPFVDAGGAILCGCEGDLNGNGSVESADLAILLGDWGPCVAIAADFTLDGNVNAEDLSILLGSWGPCP